MRRCRKLISMIVMMAMLTTMIPYQVFAADATDDPAVQEMQPAAEEAEQGQEPDTGESQPEEQKASDEAQKAAVEGQETTPTEGTSMTESTSEVTTAPDAVDNSSTDNNSNENSSTNNSSAETAEKTEEGGTPETTATVDKLMLKLGDHDELDLRIEGSFAADMKITLKEMEEDETSEQKDRMEELLEKKVDGFRAIRFMDQNGDPMTLRQKGMTLKVWGSMIPEEGLVFALLDEEGEMKTVSDFEKRDTDDGVYYEFTADSVAALFIAAADNKEETAEVKRVERTLNHEMGDQTVSVTGLLPEDAELVVVAVPLDKAAEIYAMQTGEETSKEEIAFAYDVYIVSGGQKYDLEAYGDDVTVTVSNAAAKDSKIMEVLHVKEDVIDEDGGLVEEKLDELSQTEAESESITAQTEEGTAQFNLSSFSLLIGKNAKAGDGEVDGEATIGTYYVNWNFRWANAGGSTGGGYEYKNPTTGEADSSYLFFHPQTWEDQNANLLIEMSFSGTEDDFVPANAIEIRIPLSVFKGWNGQNVDTIVTQVPKAPDTNQQSNFNYTIDTETNEIVLHNYNPISGNDYFSAEFSYRVTPLDVNGGKPDEDAAREAGFVDPTYGEGAAAGGSDIDRFCWNRGGVYRWKDYYTNEGINCSISIDPNLDKVPDYYDYDNPLSLAMITRAGGYLRIKPMPDEKGGVYTSWQSTWGARPEDADQYVYVIWNANYGTMTNYADNQPFGIEMFYDESYPAITFSKEGMEDKVLYGQMVGKMLHTFVSMQGVPSINTNSQWSIITTWGGDGSRGYYPNLGTDTTNATNKNNYATFFRSKYANTYVGSKTGQVYEYNKLHDWSENKSGYQSTHFAVLVKYPIAEILSNAETYGVDLEHDGIEIRGQYYSTETWESGYTIDRKARAVTRLFIVDRSGKGIFDKRHMFPDINNDITQGAQTTLSAGDQVDLANYTVDGFIRYPYYISYDGTSTTREVTTHNEDGEEIKTQTLIPQKLVMEEEQLMLSSAGAAHPRGWQPNGDPAAHPVGTGYDGDGNVYLTDDDYTIPRFDILKFEDYAGEYGAGVWNEAGLVSYTLAKPLFVYIRYANESEYVPYCAAVKTSNTAFTVYKCSPTEKDADGNPVIFKNAANTIATNSQKHYPLPGGVTGIRYEHETGEEVFRTKVNVTVHVILKPTDRVRECVDRDMAHVNASGVAAPVNTYVKNIANYKVYEAADDESGWKETPRHSGDNCADGKDVAEDVIWILNRITNSMATEKSTYVPKDDDPAQVEANTRNREIGYVKLQAVNYAGINKNIVYSTDMEDPYKMLSGRFYELLPRGVTIKQDSVIGVYNEYWSTHQFNASVYPQLVKYKGKGKQQVTVNGEAQSTRYFLNDGEYSITTEHIDELDQDLVIIDYSFEDPRLNMCPGNTWNGFIAFYFAVENLYTNIRTRGTGSMNYFAFENTTEGGRSVPASANRISAANLGNAAANKYQSSSADIADLFLDHVGDNNNRAAASRASMNWNAVTVLEAGYTKTVATPETLNGYPQPEEFTSEGARVTVGNRYIYQLQLTNMPTTRADNIVLYDIIESGTESEESFWKGSFVSVDTSLIEATACDTRPAARCKPKVYYSTTLTSKVEVEHPQFVLDETTIGTVWLDTCPEDPSTVTAIAIDCRTATDGEGFRLGQKGTLTAYIHMTAPLELAKDAEGNYDPEAVTLNGSVAAIRPYNETPGDINPDHARLMSRANVKLRDVNVSLIKESDPKTGTPTARTIVDSDGTGTICYRLTLRSTMPFDCNDVVITDPIPTGLTLDPEKKVTVKLNGAENETSGDSTTGFSYELAEDGRSFTFKVDQQHPTVIEIDDEGNETVVTNKDTEIYIYTTVDALVDAEGKQVFWRNYDNTATLESANGKEIDEDTETMYHRAETTKVDVSKVWDDDNDRFDKRPDSITVNLVGKAVTGTDPDTGDDIVATIDGGSLTLDEDNNWAGTFENLPMYYVVTDNASFVEPNEWYNITWTVEEEPIELDGNYVYYTSYSKQPVGPGGSVTVTNKLPVTNAEIKANKKLTGRDWEEGDSFTFTLAAKTEDAPMPEDTEITVTDGSVVSFGNIYYAFAGTYEYTVTETKEGLDGVKYDTTEHLVTVTVTQDQTTHDLSATVEYDNPSEDKKNLVIENVFSPVSVQLEVTKEITGREWLDGDEFTFTLEPVTEGAPMPETGTTVTVTKDNQTGTFETMQFKKVGDYKYTITESPSGLGGMTDDTTAHEVIITVTKDDDNALSAEVKYDENEGLTITNIYDAEGTAKFEAKKVLKGRKLKEGEFSFVLKDAEGNEIETVKNAEDGTITFSEISYVLSEDKEKLPFLYTIEEVDNKLPGVTNETGKITVEVNFTDNGDGTLNVVTTYSGLADKTFTNVYEAKGEVLIGGVKVFKGQDLKAGQFKFVLSDESGAKVLEATNDVNGNFEFEAIQYDESDLNGETEKVFSYGVVEVNDSQSDVTYDDTVYTVKVTVTDNGDGTLTAKADKNREEIKFTNTYNPPEEHHKRGSNNTGDSANGALWALMLLLAGGALAGTIWFRRRKKI